MASKVYLDILEGMRALHIAKAAGYGGRDAKVAWANFHRARELGVLPEIGALIRLSDKVTRVFALVRDSANDALKGDADTGPSESIEDTLRDLAAYALITIALRRERLAGVDEKPYWPDEVDPHVLALLGRVARDDMAELASRQGDPVLPGEVLPSHDDGAPYAEGVGPIEP